MSNEFLTRLQTRIKESRTKLSVSEWVCQNTTLRENVPFSFKGHAFQRDILDCKTKICYVKKLAQCGLSEVSFRSALEFMVNNPGTSVLYAYPTIDMKLRNSQTRIMPILNRDFPVPKGSNWIRNSNIMQIENSFLYMSSNSESDSNSTSIDYIILDEYDLMGNNPFVSMVNSRMQASKHRIKRCFSTPTFTDFSISRDFATSDMREYFVKCPHCNHWQVPLYDLNSVHIPNLPKSVDRLVEDITPEIAASLDYANSYVKCTRCSKPLHLGDDAQREWVATHPDRVSIAGFQVRPFSSDLLSIEYLATTLADFVKRDEIRRGYNTVLGLEYTNNSTRMEIGDIEACMVDERIPVIPEKEPCFLGLDQGVTCTLTLSCKDYDVFLFEELPFDKVLDRFKELDSLYNIVAGMVDRAPDILLSSQLRDLSGGRIMPVIYGNGKNIEPHKELNGNIDYYNINRTNSLDRVQNAINSHKMRISGYTHYKQKIITHLRDMFRDPKTDGDGQPVWVKLSGQDHGFHSLGYNLTSRYMYDYINSSSSSDDRFCLGISGPASSILDSQNKTLYNENLLQYSKDIQKHKVKRLR